MQVINSWNCQLDYALYAYEIVLYPFPRPKMEDFPAKKNKFSSKQKEYQDGIGMKRFGTMVLYKHVLSPRYGHFSQL